MKEIVTKIVWSSCMVFSVLMTSPTIAQIPDIPDYDPEAFNISEFLKAGSEDASTLMGQYLNPVFRGFGFGANGGWYNTAATHKPLGFDITVSVMAAKTPSDQFFFDFMESNYINTTLHPESPTDVGSTVFGDPDSGDQLILQSSFTDEQSGTTISTSFNAPPGLDYDALGISGAEGYVPFVMVQGGIGLFKNTDLKVRWVPTTSYDVGGVPFEIGMFGLGLMHDIKQWIPGIKHVPIDISAFAGYNRLYSTLGIDNSADGAIEGDNQSAEFGINTFTYQLLVSKKLSILTIYGGGGYSSASSTLKVLGTYDIPDDIDPSDIITLTNPIDEEFKSDGWRGTLGLRLQLAIITLHGDYTFQEYPMITAGLGVTVR